MSFLWARARSVMVFRWASGWSRLTAATSVWSVTSWMAMPAGGALDRPNQREVEFAGLDRVEQAIGVSLGERDFHGGVLVVEGGQQVGQFW
jgi:hypothetical protein